MIWLGWVLWHINHCRLSNVRSSLYTYIKYIWFGFVGFYGISAIVGYLMSNPFYTYTINIYDLVWFGLVWFGLVLCYINHCKLFNAKSSLYIYNKYIWFVNKQFIGNIIFNGVRCHLFVYSKIISSIAL